MKGSLPPLQESKYDPLCSTLSQGDNYERWLLSLDEEHFEKLFPLIDLSKEGPVVTGDPVIDQAERDLWEQSHGAVKT